jgi:XapX domain-containing protein
MAETIVAVLALLILPAITSWNISTPRGVENLHVIIAGSMTGLATGALFRFLQIPIPAPPNSAGILGIVGIYLGYRLVQTLDVGFDLLGALGF